MRGAQLPWKGSGLNGLLGSTPSPSASIKRLFETMSFFVNATFFSWLAFALGALATWVTGKHRVGWILSAVSAASWLAFGVVIRQPAEIVASAVSVVLAVRNFRVWHKRDA